MGKKRYCFIKKALRLQYLINFKSKRRIYSIFLRAKAGKLVETDKVQIIEF